MQDLIKRMATLLRGAKKRDRSRALKRAAWEIGEWAKPGDRSSQSKKERAVEGGRVRVWRADATWRGERRRERRWRAGFWDQLGRERRERRRWECGEVEDDGGDGGDGDEDEDDSRVSRDWRKEEER